MKNNILGFLISALLHVSVLAQLWISTHNKPDIKPKETVHALSLAMFQEPPKPVAPIIKSETRPTPVPPLQKKVARRKEIKKAPKPLPVVKKVVPHRPEKHPEKAITKKKKVKKIVKKDVRKIVKRIPKPVTKKISKPRIKPKAVKAPTQVARKKRTQKMARKVQRRVQFRPRVRTKSQTNTLRQPISAPLHRSRQSKPALSKVTVKAKAVRQPSRPVTRARPLANTARFETDYKSRLRQLIEANKKYPRRAMQRGKQGIVKLSFVILPDGTISRITLVQSSGSRILDHAAKKAVSRISGKLPFPKEIRKKQWQFSLPLTYRLKR